MTITDLHTTQNSGISPVKTSRDRPILSACMIVKNEQKFLPQCLQSIKDAVDEIIIVDTGSTDKTVEIAHSFGARVYHHPWKNSFSEARNYSLNHATGDWILQIDADEALEQADIPLLYKLITADSYNAIFVAIYSDLPGGRSKHYYTRVFRRGKAHFEGIVHNQLIFEGKAFQSEIRFYHYGYNLSESEMQKKYKRTGDLLRQQLVENPNNIFVMANLIRNYRNEYNFKKVIELGEKGLNISISQEDFNSQSQRQRIYIDLAYALLNINQVDRAEGICKEAVKENPDSLDILFLLGEILLKKEAFNDALRYFKKYLIIKDKENKKPTFNLSIVDAYYYEDKAYDNIGVCYESLGLINDAEVAYKKAIELNSREPLYYSNLASLYVSQNRLEEAENMANAAVKLDTNNYLIYLLLGKIQAMRKKPHEAINTVKQLLQKNDKNIHAHIFLINLLIETNRLKEAEKAVEMINPTYPDHLGLKCITERIKYKKGNKKSAIQFIQNILNSSPSNNSVYHDLGNLCIEIEEYEKAIELLEIHLKTSSTDATVITNIATCYAKLGKLESAIIGLQAALKIDPGCNYALQNLVVLKKKFL
ncbi:MAG: tetratricopeptide repeat protein [Candidatus Brocadia sp.]|nr:tetratricopeptide repeat protein [Candidatus Brocadia sp.]